MMLPKTEKAESHTLCWDPDRGKIICGSDLRKIQLLNH